LSKPLAGGENNVSMRESAGQGRVSLFDSAQPVRHGRLCSRMRTLTSNRYSSAFHWRVRGPIGPAVIHLPLVPAAAPICADDFGAASYVSPPP